MIVPELLDEYRIPYRLGGTHKDVRLGYVGLGCPWCGVDSGKFYLGIEIETGRSSCWQCGPKQLGKILYRLCNLSYKEVASKLNLRTSGVSRRDLRPRGYLHCPRTQKELMEPHRTYLRHRGFDPDVIQNLWGVQCTNHLGKLPWRLFIPIRLEDKVVSWTTRCLWDDNLPRYVSAKPTQEIIPHKEVLYGAELARHAIVICEGPLDAWAIGPGAVCSFGLTYTDYQMRAMGRFPVRAVCFDNEPMAHQQAEKLARQLNVFPGETYVIRLESGKDPAECDPAEIESIRNRFL